MPTPPKPQRRVIIRHTPNHILGWIDSVHERPQAEEPPRYQKLKQKRKKSRYSRNTIPTPTTTSKTDLQPNDHEVPEPNHTDLRGASPNPRFPVFDGDDVHKVEDELHRHKGDDEAEEVLHRWTWWYGRWTSLLQDPQHLVLEREREIR